MASNQDSGSGGGILRFARDLAAKARAVDDLSDDWLLRLAKRVAGPPRAASPRTVPKVDNKAAEVLSICREDLRASGFAKRKRDTIWRVTDRKVDILKFWIVPPTRCEVWRIPIGSFALYPGCILSYLPVLPRPGASTTHSLSPNWSNCQFGMAIERTIRQWAVRGNNNIWWASPRPKDFDAVVHDVRTALRDKVLPFYEQFEDPQNVLRILQEYDGTSGAGELVGFGNMGSVHRLLLTGFAALECEKWELAQEAFDACRDEETRISNRFAELSISCDRDSQFIDAGLAHAEQKRRWSIHSP